MTDARCPALGDRAAETVARGKCPAAASAALPPACSGATLVLTM
jgi:hypothetical protein